MNIFFRYSKLWVQILRQIIFIYIKKIENVFYSIFNKKKELQSATFERLLKEQSKW